MIGSRAAETVAGLDVVHQAVSRVVDVQGPVPQEIPLEGGREVGKAAVLDRAGEPSGEVAAGEVELDHLRVGLGEAAGEVLDIGGRTGWPLLGE